MAHGGARKGAGRKPGKVSQAKRTIAEMAKEHGPLALQTLVDVASDDGAPHAAKVSAANALLDRGYGKPAQSHDLTSSDGTMTPQGVSDDLRAALDAIAGKLSTSDGEGQVAGDGETGADSTSG